MGRGAGQYVQCCRTQSRLKDEPRPQARELPYVSPVDEADGGEMQILDMKFPGRRAEDGCK
jgi:hypothetical protein